MSCATLPPSLDQPIEHKERDPPAAKGCQSFPRWQVAHALRHEHQGDGCQQSPTSESDDGMAKFGLEPLGLDMLETRRHAAERDCRASEGSV